MKKFKLLVATMLVAVMAFAFAACGGSDIEGKWVLKQATMTMGSETIDMIEEGGMSMTLEIKDDGTFEISMSQGNQSETGSGTWKFEDGSLTLSGEGGEDYLGADVLKLEKGKLTASHSEDNMTATMVFEKE